MITSFVFSKEVSFKLFEVVNCIYVASQCSFDQQIVVGLMRRYRHFKKLIFLKDNGLIALN